MAHPCPTTPENIHTLCVGAMQKVSKINSAISEKRLIKAVMEYLEQLLNGIDFTISYMEKDAPELTEQEQWEKDLENLSIREKRIRIAYETGVDSLEEYKENKARLKREREELENKKKQVLSRLLLHQTRKNSSLIKSKPSLIS